MENKLIMGSTGQMISDLYVNNFTGAAEPKLKLIEKDSERGNQLRDY